MKKSVIIFAMLSVVVAFISCEQNSMMSANAPLEVTKTSAIKKGEPILFTFKSSLSEDKIEWNVSPNQNVKITPEGNKARILFGAAGNYTVTATDHITTARTAVTVDSTTYSPADSIANTDTTVIVIPRDTIKVVIQVPIDTVTHTPADTIGTHDIMVAIAGDEFTFIPSIVDSASGSGLRINLVSTKKYQCLNSHLYLNYEIYNVTGKEFKMNLNRVVQPGSKYCEAGEKQISAVTDIYPLSDGSNKLDVSLNGNTYQGTIIKTGNSYNIVWPYTSGIKFSKLTLTK